MSAGAVTDAEAVELLKIVRRRIDAELGALERGSVEAAEALLEVHAIDRAMSLLGGRLGQINAGCVGVQLNADELAELLFLLGDTDDDDERELDDELLDELEQRFIYAAATLRRHRQGGDHQ